MNKSYPGGLPVMMNSQRDQGQDEWAVTYKNLGSSEATVQALAYCLEGRTRPLNATSRVPCLGHNLDRRQSSSWIRAGTRGFTSQKESPRRGPGGSLGTGRRDMYAYVICLRKVERLS